ncbi:carbohydrate ABC transporter permease [Paenibacillus pasadenensis]|uniref:carbohydrate ABC transporter permease n=1 Tax=Paenibacillus pasadenensis TaxID=217090 RepID=UPI00203FBA21|nr:carbohydrate ABC transporter permease [Paenibacillus pasadenensis]MCM3747007.1 carbohydrate ABC transporter permease [Paenibacillus pasadenensis]
MRIWKRFEWFDAVNYTLLLLICVIMLYPFVNVAAVSFSSYSSFLENPMMIWPKQLSFAAYNQILSHPVLLSSYTNTIIITVCGVAIGIFLYIITAYPLSKKHLKGRNFFMVIVIFTMLFNGGLIPNFYLIRELGLLDTLTALVVPMLLSGFNLILMKNFMESLPEELEEAAKMDGASEPYLLFRIIVPLSMPIIATLCLFTAVGYWNNFFNAVIYIRSVENWPLMLFLREIIEGARMQEISGANAAEVGKNAVVPETLKYATLMIVMVPILCVYPFVQKYFVQGITLGSVKG